MSARRGNAAGLGRRGRLAGLSALAACLGPVLLPALRSSGHAQSPASKAPRAMTVVSKGTLRLSAAALADLGLARARIRDFPETLDIQGGISVVENEATVVSCRVNNGRVDQVLRVTGDTVRAGDPLALLYSPDFVSAREEYLLIRSKDASGAGDLDGFVAEAREKLERMGLTDRDIAALARPSDDRLVVRAPRDGVITSVNTMVGNLQNEGDTLFTTANLDRVWFSGDVYLEDLPKVRRGQRILIRAEGLPRPLEGALSFISPVVDPVVRTVKVRALIPNPGHRLRAAMFVQGSLVLKDAPALVVPRAAVLALDRGDYCFKRVGPDSFQEVPVTLGRESGALAGVSSGLSEGDEVVSTDPATLDYVLNSAGGAP